MLHSGDNFVPVTPTRVAGESGHAPRNAAVDAARLLFAFGVVVIHLAPPEHSGGGLLAQVFLVFAVQYFFLISLYFFVKRVRALDEVKWSDLHLDRILVPYATWTVLYTLFRLAKCLLLKTPFEFDVLRVAFYGAGAIQLYFIPLLFLWQMLALSVLLFVRSPPRRLLAIGVLAAAIGFGLYGQMHDYYCFQNALTNGGVYVGLAFALHLVHSRSTWRKANVMVGTLLVAAGIAAALLEFSQRRWLGPFAAYGVAALALNWDLRITSRAWRYAFSCSFAIYLAHLVFVETLRLGAIRAGMPLHLESAVTTAFAATGICAICILLAALARTHRLPRYLVFGEGSPGTPER